MEENYNEKVRLPRACKSNTMSSSKRAKRPRMEEICPTPYFMAATEPAKRGRKKRSNAAEDQEPGTSYGNIADQVHRPAPNPEPANYATVGSRRDTRLHTRMAGTMTPRPQTSRHADQTSPDQELPSCRYNTRSSNRVIHNLPLVAAPSIHQMPYMARAVPPPVTAYSNGIQQIVPTSGPPVAHRSLPSTKNQETQTELQINEKDIAFLTELRSKNVDLKKVCSILENNEYVTMISDDEKSDAPKKLELTPEMNNIVAVGYRSNIELLKKYILWKASSRKSSSPSRVVPVNTSMFPLYPWSYSSMQQSSSENEGQGSMGILSTLLQNGQELEQTEHNESSSAVEVQQEISPNIANIVESNVLNTPTIQPQVAQNVSVQPQQSPCIQNQNMGTNNQNIFNTNNETWHTNPPTPSTSNGYQNCPGEIYNNLPNTQYSGNSSHTSNQTFRNPDWSQNRQGLPGLPRMSLPYMNLCSQAIAAAAVLLPQMYHPRFNGPMDLFPPHGVFRNSNNLPRPPPWQ